MTETDWIEKAVLCEIEKYEWGTFSDGEIVAIQVKAVEVCSISFDPFEMWRKVEKIVRDKYNEIY